MWEYKTDQLRIAKTYSDEVTANLKVEWSYPYNGFVELFQPLNTHYRCWQQRQIMDKVVIKNLPPQFLAAKKLCLLVSITRAGHISSELLTTDNVVVYDLAISTSGGGSAHQRVILPLLAGKVERVFLIIRLNLLARSTRGY